MMESVLKKPVARVDNRRVFWLGLSTVVAALSASVGIQYGVIKMRDAPKLITMSQFAGVILACFLLPFSVCRIVSVELQGSFRNLS